jgi:hypothetical protein
VSRAGRWTAALTGLAAVVLTAACSTVPTSSPTIQITQAASRPTTDVGIEPLPPEDGATSDEVVRGFIDAAASDVRGHPVARQFLTSAAARTWSDEAGITVITDVAAVTTDTGAVQVTATLVGTVDPHGIFTVGSQRAYTRSFALQQVKKQWRIIDPPDGLLLLQPDFERLYDQRDAFFLDPTGQRVVPDPRYLITGQAQPNALVQRLLDGPSPALAHGVRNPLQGAELRRSVTVTPRGVTVDLTGIGTPPTPVLSEICAQLVWTLDQLSLRNVEVLLDGQPVDIDGVPSVQSIGDWSSFDPEAVPVGAVGHYLAGGALHRTIDGKPVNGPAGMGQYGLTAAAISADDRTGELSAVAATTGGPAPALLVGSYGGDLAQVLNGGTLTAPTVASTRPEFWVVRDGSDVVRVTVGGQPQTVDVPALPGLGRVQALRLSPDGVRAAVVVDGTLYVGTVVRSDDGGVTLGSLQAIAPLLTLVSDVAWDSSGSLVVLAGDAGQDREVPYEVGVDGWGLESVSTAGLPGQPTELGDAPGRQLLVVAGGTIWQQSGGTWTTLIRGQEPVPGSAPFYPL